jgi:hypothetical protein
MKFIRSIFALALVALSFPVLAQTTSTSITAFSGGGSSGTTSSYISSANASGQAVYQYVSATSDLSSSALTFYTAGSPATVTLATNSGQTVIYATNSFSGSDVLVIRSVANDTYQRGVVSSVTTSNITLSANLSFALAAGDKVYKMTSAGSIPVGAATKEVVSAGGYWHGQKGKPTLVDLTGTSTCKINAIAGSFLP